MDGRKADIEFPKRLMPGTVAPGSAIRLADYTDELGVAEGIETAISAGLIFGIPCWSTVSEGFMRSWIPPKGLKRVVIFGDNDENLVGQAAAYELGKRVKVQYCIQHVEVFIPKKVKDWNDVAASMKLEISIS
jgi:putative DNA primase/helicase